MNALLSLLTTLILSACFFAPPVAPPPQGPYNNGGYDPNQGGPYPTNPNPTPDYTPPADYRPAEDAKGAITPAYPRVMIMIPEFHITTKVPDPAAETEFLKYFKTAGFKLIDKKQAEKVWKDDVLYKLEKEEDLQAAAALAFKIGAEILIIGEAFSEKGVQVNSGGYGGVPGQIVTAGARVEIKAIRVDTGEILWADSEYAKAADTTELIAGKRALQEGGKALAPKVAKELLRQWSTGGAGKGANAIEIVLSYPNGVLKFADVTDFKENSMKAVAGLQQVVQREFVEGVAMLELVYEGDAQGLAGALDGKKIGKKTCEITKISGNKIFVNLK